MRQLNVRKSFSFTIFFLFLILSNNQIQPNIIFKEYTKCHMSIQHMLKGGTIKKKTNKRRRNETTKTFSIHLEGVRSFNKKYNFCIYIYHISLLATSYPPSSDHQRHQDMTSGSVADQEAFISLF